MELFNVFLSSNTMAALAISQEGIEPLLMPILGVVFALIGLMALRYLSQIASALRGIENQKSQTAASVQTSAVQTAAMPIAPVASASSGDEITEELVAVITAAIAASLDTHTGNIVVKNIRRVSQTTPTWAVAGRSEQLGSRF